MATDRNRVCPPECAPSLDNWLRRWLQNPREILAPYAKEGMTVLDVGCGPGYFSVELAKLVGQTGRVIAVDLQEEMLQKLAARTEGTALDSRIKRVQCGQNSINVTESVDFILAFYMVHEVPDKFALFTQLKSVLKESGRFLLVEPKLMHVSRKEFDITKKIAESVGFRVAPGPHVVLSWSALLSNL